MSGTEVIADRFEVLGPQARGNMGEVHRARDLETGEIVAVKVIRRRRSGEEVSLTEADKNAARFEREVRIMARLSSPNLPRTIAGGLDGDRPYLAMEFIDGVTLSSLLNENGRLPVAWAAAIGAQIAQGLDAAHKAGVVHRDLKPSNVMLAADGLVKVLDFGVGLILDDVEGGPRLTSSDVTVGTARYMAPEQATQHAAVTGAVDLYALGCVLYEMLTGAPPFDDGSTYEVLKRHIEQQSLPVSELRGEFDAALHPTPAVGKILELHRNVVGHVPGLKQPDLREGRLQFGDPVGKLRGLEKFVVLLQIVGANPKEIGNQAAKAAERDRGERQHGRRIFQHGHVRQAQRVAVMVQRLLHLAGAKQQRGGEHEQKKFFEARVHVGKRKKLQAPSSKLQRNSKSKAPSRTIESTHLVVGAWCFFGCWWLVLGIFIGFPAPSPVRAG